MAKKEKVFRSKPKRVMIAFTPSEFQVIDAKARKVGLVASTYIRQVMITQLNG